MLEHLRLRSAAALAQSETVTLTTCGPADIQSDALACRALDERIYLLVPRSSDQLLNIEQGENVLVTAPAWRLRGRARILPETDIPGELQAEPPPEAAWSVWVEVIPLRLTLFDVAKKWFETIDF